jgi:hypothetical protein
MTYYHVRITVQGEKEDEVKNDIDEETLENQFLRPYRSGAPITINGRVIESNQLARCRGACASAWATCSASGRPLTCSRSSTAGSAVDMHATL